RKGGRRPAAPAWAYRPPAPRKRSGRNPAGGRSPGWATPRREGHAPPGPRRDRSTPGTPPVGRRTGDEPGQRLSWDDPPKREPGRSGCQQHSIGPVHPTRMTQQDGGQLTRGGERVSRRGGPRQPPDVAGTGQSVTGPERD